MDTNTLLKEVRENLLEADLPQLEVWYSQLASLYAWICEQVGEVKKERALDEIAIKQQIIERGEKPTEDGIQREYYATSKGQYLALNNEYQKAVSKLLSAVKFRIENLKNF